MWEELLDYEDWSDDFRILSESKTTILKQYDPSYYYLSQEYRSQPVLSK